MPARKRSSPAGQRFIPFFILLIIAVVAAVWVWQNLPQSQTPTTAPSGSGTVRVATWNLRQFSSGRTVDRRTITGVITSSHFDVMAIQEVKKQGEEVDALLNALSGPWRATSISPMTGNSERFAFIYDGAHVREIGQAHFVESPDVAVFDRRPYQASFKSGNFDFTLVTVHLSYTNIERRRHEAEALVRIARDIAASSNEKDIIVLGDFNEQPAHANLHYFTEAGWKSLNHEPSNLGSTFVFDTLIIDPKYTTEWSGSTGVVRFDEQYFHNDDKIASQQVSDHRPAYADFATTGADDD